LGSLLVQRIRRMTIIVSNSGRGAAITNVKVDVKAPVGWDVFIEPKEISAIQPKESGIVVLKVKVPIDTLPSEYKLQVNVKSDQTTVKEEFKVTVKEKSYSLIWGSLIVSASILSLVLIFRKFGRK